MSGETPVITSTSGWVPYEKVVTPDADGFEGKSPLASFMVQSVNQATWDGAPTAGAVLGFLVFGIGMIVSIVWIFIDISKYSA